MDDRRGARFTGVDFRGARFRDVDMRDVKIVDAMLGNADISGLIDGLRVNDVEVAPLIEAELDRRHPERVRLRANDPNGMRDAWTLVEDLWSATMARAQRLPEAALRERVDEEWSFVETLRHLIFVTDAWVRRPVLGDPHPYCEFGLVHTPLGSGAWLGIDDAAVPTLDEVRAVRRDRRAEVRRIVDALTPEELARTCAQNPEPGYPEQTEVTVHGCLSIVMTEEWHHHQYAIRDLAVLETRTR